MTYSSTTPFIDPTTLNFPQLIFLTTVYGYTLFQASNLISDGSELLLFIPALEGIIGSVILPVLGVVPDAMIVLFSGLGDRDQVHDQVAVGVGTLAGSTIMLLTIPWSIAIFSGRVNILKDGTANYKRPKGDTEWQKLMPAGNMSLSKTGVRCGEELKANALLMLFTMSAYFLIQVPAFYDDVPSLTYDQQGRSENRWAFYTFVYSGVWFIIYLAYQYRDSIKEDSQSISRTKEIDNIVELIHEGKFTLMDTMSQFRHEAEVETGSHAVSDDYKRTNGLDNEEPLLSPGRPLPKRAIIRMKAILVHFFNKYDENKDHEISRVEFYLICQDIGLNRKEIQDRLFEDSDIDQNGSISIEEFVSCMVDCARHKLSHENEGPQPKLPNQRSISQIHNIVHGMDDEEDDIEEATSDGDAHEDEEEEEEEEPPEDLKELPAADRKRWILYRSFRMMLFGTAIVLAFSPAMVDVLAELGHRMEISPFYTSFVIAPIASNAGELVAAYNYARKRTERSITVSCSTLQGAACMNNTLCLSIFMGMIYYRSLAWQFSAECLSILVVQVIMTVYSYCRRTQTLMDAIWIVSLYPLSLLFVWMLKNPDMGGMD
ncbi:unnamed protein product [Polarella glacialis]|uniref:EF-hand domain-containing protein n=4 Tax=Polarella glacialis TaxID=89957 RepID=A0A813FI83_POLGL|nr:unnamed protein product [Polarella glacialis]|mmetsp:Transcript_100536/g.181460  ORF Transcript_100536/g.181460 Transcript_100536/m.181460 type:complete len:601 (+) Transcript_100536:90-1892(+)